MKNRSMKSRRIVHAREEARIYQNYYKPSLNVFFLLRSILSVFISGSSPAASSFARRK
ncbi:MAG TPA: hypothetical protein VF476_02655 [Chitinophagaceae bacterium]